MLSFPDITALRPVMFIADLHLDESRPDTIELARQFLRFAESASALFILGDLFEYWLGDDALDPHADTALNAFSTSLTRLTQSGTPVWLMHGNRDFLLGEGYAERVGATLIRDDLQAVSLGNTRTLLMHGDTLCTDDLGYQQLRALVRDPQWQAGFLGKSVAERVQEAQALRDRSRSAIADKSDSIMDVNTTAVVESFDEAQWLIHGHTHRPADHAVIVDGSERRRVVLGDWHGDHTHFARFDGNNLTLQRFAPD